MILSCVFFSIQSSDKDISLLSIKFFLVPDIVSLDYLSDFSTFLFYSGLSLIRKILQGKWRNNPRYQFKVKNNFFYFNSIGRSINIDPIYFPDETCKNQYTTIYGKFKTYLWGFCCNKISSLRNATLGEKNLFFLFFRNRLKRPLSVF